MIYLRCSENPKHCYDVQPDEENNFDNPHDMAIKMANDLLKAFYEYKGHGEMFSIYESGLIVLWSYNWEHVYVIEWKR